MLTAFQGTTERSKSMRTSRILKKKAKHPQPEVLADQVCVFGTIFARKQTNFILAKLDENAAKAKPVTMNVGQGSKSPAADDVMQQLFALQSMSNQLNKEREEDGRKQTDAKKPAKSGKSKLSTPQTSTKTEKKAPATTKKGRGYESDVESSSRGEKRNRVDLEPLREQISFLKQQMDELKLVHNKEKTEWEQEKKRLEAEKTKLQKEKEEQAIERAKLEGRMQGLEELVKAKEEMLSYFRSKH